MNDCTDNTDECVKLDTRLAGQVRRYHTWPILGQQTIAEHCWQIMRIYMSIVDKPDPHMMYHITFHDIGEHFTGDIPYPVKRDNHNLKEQMEFLERRSYMSQLDYWNAFQMTYLNEEEKKLFKQIELIEMAEFGLDQVCLGNQHGLIIADRCLRAVYENSPSTRLCNYVMKRLTLFYRQYDLAMHISLDGEWWYVEYWEKLNVSK
jgi:5'-deoxynucleotidase YfbR-like HD superfamily hydrolase